MTSDPVARIRGEIYQLRKFKELTRHQLDQHLQALEEAVRELEREREQSRQKSAPLRFALSALMQSVERGKEGIYRVRDAELFIWSMDELTRLTEP